MHSLGENVTSKSAVDSQVMSTYLDETIVSVEGTSVSGVERSLIH